VDIPNLPIVAEFIQMGKMYITPNYNFLYTRTTKHENEMSSPKKDTLNQNSRLE
jgi:hypothetical protein